MMKNLYSFETVLIQLFIFSCSISYSCSSQESMRGLLTEAAISSPIIFATMSVFENSAPVKSNFYGSYNVPNNSPRSFVDFDLLDGPKKYLATSYNTNVDKFNKNTKAREIKAQEIASLIEKDFGEIEKMTLNFDGSIQGKVIDSLTGEPLIFASVVMYQNGSLVSGVETDFDGWFVFSNCAEGVFKLEAHYLGYVPLIIEKVELKKDALVIVNFEMSEQTQSFQYPKILAYSVPKHFSCGTTQGKTPSDDMSKLSRTITSLKNKSDDDLSSRKIEDKPTAYFMNGARVKLDKEMSGGKLSRKELRQMKRKLRKAERKKRKAQGTAKRKPVYLIK